MENIEVLKLINSGAAAVSAVVLICMLQSRFRPSSRYFRWSVKCLAGALLVVASSPWLGIPWSPLLDLLQNLSLAAVLVMMRKSQARFPWCSD